MAKLTIRPHGGYFDLVADYSAQRFKYEAVDEILTIIEQSLELRVNVTIAAFYVAYDQRVW